MKEFMDESFLLSSEFSQTIFEAIKDLPIIDYHCHIDAKEICENKRFGTITEVWLGGDHYKWRAMRNMGIDEKYITGDASDYDKFVAYATIMPYMAGHPLFHFSHLELQRFFDIKTPLTKATAKEIYDKANAKLAELPAKKLIEASNVEVIVTTNDPLDSLCYHEQLAQDKDFKTRVLPAFRPDKAINIENKGFNEYIALLAKLCHRSITSLEDLKFCLKERLAFFVEHGCVASDHGITHIPFVASYKQLANVAFQKAIVCQPLTTEECDAYKTAMLMYLAGLYKDNNVTMELHYGCSRNTNSVMFDKLGADTGYDTIRRDTHTDNLTSLLNEMNKGGILPKTVIYSLDPTDDNAICTIMGSYHEAGTKGKVQQGSAWWFNDNKEGMKKQIATYATQSPIDTFIGMLTDSRSFLSYPRHEYFRRILSNYLGELVANGEYPKENIGYLIEIAKNIAYNNVKSYLFSAVKKEQ